MFICTTLCSAYAHTNQLMQAQEEDFLAAAYLSRFCDSQLLSTVLQASRSKRVMEVIERSLRNRIIQNSFSIAGVGYLRYDDRDAIPQAADFLITEENVHTAVVYGIVHDEDAEREVVIGSLRTNKLTLDPDEFIKRSLWPRYSGALFLAADERWQVDLRSRWDFYPALTKIVTIQELSGMCLMLKLSRSSSD